MVANRDRAVIACPGIVSGHLEPADIAEVGAAPGQFCLDALAVETGVGGDKYLLLVTEGVHQLIVKRLDIGQQSRPVGAGMWPGDLDGILGRPFGQ